MLLCFTPNLSSMDTLEELPDTYLMRKKVLPDKYPIHKKEHTIFILILISDTRQTHRWTRPDTSPTHPSDLEEEHIFNFHRSGQIRVRNHCLKLILNQSEFDHWRIWNWSWKSSDLMQIRVLVMVSTTAAAAAAMFLNWGLGFILWWVWICATSF